MNLDQVHQVLNPSTLNPLGTLGRRQKLVCFESGYPPDISRRLTSLPSCKMMIMYVAVRESESCPLMLVVSEIEIEDRTLRSRVGRIYDESQLFSVINSRNKYVSRKNGS